ncbi:hypothetical protein GCK32_008164, partial [Trichostrongylus colubriformis]
MSTADTIDTGNAHVEMSKADTIDTGSTADWKDDVIDYLVFFGLITNTYSLWAFPAKAISFGG